jgi:hypothetical protein
VNGRWGPGEEFASRLFGGAHVTKTNALESLVIASFVRGLSVCDVEASLAEALGTRPRFPSPSVACSRPFQKLLAGHSRSVPLDHTRH